MNLTPNEQYRLSMKSTAAIQRDLDLIRLAYRERDMQPLNRRRITLEHWIGFSLIAIAILVPAIAATIFLLL